MIENTNTLYKNELLLSLSFFCCTFSSCYRNESWYSASEFCNKTGGSLPQLDIRDDIQLLQNEEESYVVYLGLKWVSLLTGFRPANPLLQMDIVELL